MLQLLAWPVQALVCGVNKTSLTLRMVAKAGIRSLCHQALNVAAVVTVLDFGPCC